MAANLNATDREHWAAHPTGRNAHRTLVPLVGNSAWAQALGPTHLAWMFLREAPPNWQRPSAPDIWFVFRSNPAISFWQSSRLVETMANMPFVVAFAYTFDETNHMADILLPEATDLEGTQLIRIGGTKFVEQFWEHQGVALRQPAVEPPRARRATSPGSPPNLRAAADCLSTTTPLSTAASVACRSKAAITISRSTRAAHTQWRKSGTPNARPRPLNFRTAPRPRISPGSRSTAFIPCRSSGSTGISIRRWWNKNLRFELPYQERLFRAGQELANRLHEHDIHWWDDQLEEYAPLPVWDDVPARWERALRKMGGDPADYPLWLITTKSMQYSAGNNAGIPLMNEVGAEHARPRRRHSQRRDCKASWYSPGRPGRSSFHHRQHARLRRVDAGYPSRHGRNYRAIRSLEDAVCQGSAFPEPQYRGAAVARSD